MAVFLSPVGGAAAQFFTNSGVPLAGGKLFTYAAGTTTPAATYTSSSGVTAHTNPIILNSAGRVATSEIWLTESVSYKFLLKDSYLSNVQNFIPFINHIFQKKFLYNLIYKNKFHFYHYK